MVYGSEKLHPHGTVLGMESVLNDINVSVLHVTDNILDIDALTDEQEQVLNSISVEYGMRGMDYSEYVALPIYAAVINDKRVFSFQATV